ncbi:hypothetical protein HNQ80_004352 [Anaerosolibacter carboniphilus]|uniref:Uncharacterized protein n=1 Tax=Anaerosolibacter carboniphilus TaxID=1417629 RepID=A0A841L525_9FIRM|nr:hypothetical protein [Anaerosolibacter carboniphilus]MBB6218212.1 hypothetical protein [Anaerosolibacter carboniphilus]
MKPEILEYCLRSIVRHMNGDFDEFERLSSMAQKHYEAEKAGQKLYYAIGDVIPISVKERIYQAIA